MWSTLVGGAAGKLPGLPSPEGYGSVTKQIVTKAMKGLIGQFSGETALKMFIYESLNAIPSSIAEGVFDSMGNSPK